MLVISRYLPCPASEYLSPFCSLLLLRSIILRNPGKEGQNRDPLIPDALGPIPSNFFLLSTISHPSHSQFCHLFLLFVVSIFLLVDLFILFALSSFLPIPRLILVNCIVLMFSMSVAIRA